MLLKIVTYKKYKNLMNINLKHASDLAGRIPRSIASSPFLTTLAISQSHIADDDVKLILDNIGESPLLLHLDLSHNKITSKGARAITEMLVAPSESILACLDISGNKISSEGASIMGQALATNESLLSLTLRLNSIGDEGGKDLFEGLKQNATLRHLNLSANKLGSSSAMNLLKLLDEKASPDCELDSIVLTSNEFAEEEVGCLSQCKVCYVDVRTSCDPAKNGNESLASEMPSK